jgi:mono/diheme cytochrome c family protein
MRRFLLGFLVAVVLVVLVGFSYVRFGLLDPRADIPINRLEEKIAMPALDASVDRRAPEIKNPVDSDDPSLIAGMKIYQTDCASCHGDVNHSRGMLADSLYPRAPQFVEDAPDMPEYQNFYIIQHGIRLSGMPAWRQSLSEQQMWQVTTFLSHIDKLPPSVSDQWKAAAGPSAEGNPSSARPSPLMDDKMRMK